MLTGFGQLDTGGQFFDQSGQGIAGIDQLAGADASGVTDFRGLLHRTLTVAGQNGYVLLAVGDVAVDDASDAGAEVNGDFVLLGRLLVDGQQLGSSGTDRFQSVGQSNQLRIYYFSNFGHDYFPYVCFGGFASMKGIIPQAGYACNPFFTLFLVSPAKSPSSS